MRGGGGRCIVDKKKSLVSRTSKKARVSTFGPPHSQGYARRTNVYFFFFIDFIFTRTMDFAEKEGLLVV